jgi:hypothetical protein
MQNKARLILRATTRPFLFLVLVSIILLALFGLARAEGATPTPSTDFEVWRTA